MSVSGVQNDGEIVRILAVIAAGILLNFGLFLFLFVFSPMVAGVVGGYLFNRYRIGAATGAVAASVAYCIIFITLSSTDIVTIIIAVLTMTMIGATGGLLGVFLRSKSR